MKMKFMLLAAAALTLAACTGKSDATGTTDDTATPADTAIVAEQPAAAQLPAFTAGKVNELTDDNVLTPTTKVGKVTAVDFNATWCGPCKAFAPIFEAAAAKYADRVDFVSVDIDKCPATATAFGIESIPTVVILTPSGDTLSNVGLISAEQLAEIIEGKL